METQKILVSGQVQGVGFRWSATRLAKQMTLTGTVRNLTNGQVEIIATGESATLQQFCQQLKHGLSPWINVMTLTTQSIPTHQFADFRIII
ncbi:acylphosphatase [Levilactobacillus brevis]|uniref:acylphosphatase n=1 Tax=Levilactobacillus brevis TaxID=1580 RepID=UPI001BA7F834|nr:acylphosphatase [Levilactobacillus brevis]MBS1005813.1 acylphosphatase [Levilactobacillus brevis]MBS1013142.1 acylphosphatase [Levilactobacillus brevis]